MMMKRKELSDPRWWAGFIERPDAHLGMADRAVLARLLLDLADHRDSHILANELLAAQVLRLGEELCVLRGILMEGEE